MAKEKEKEIDVRVKLDGTLSEKFRRLKEAYGLKNNTEVIRRLITEAAGKKEKENEKEKEKEERKT